MTPPFPARLHVLLGLMWACQGRLFASSIRSAGIYAAAELYDFNPMKFEAIEAPY